MYPQVINRVFRSTWAIHKPMLFDILTVLHTRLGRSAAEGAGPILADANRAEEEGEGRGAKRRREMRERYGRTEVIFASGVVGKHLSSLEEMCAGGLSLDRLSARLIEAADDDEVSHIMLWMDSPGGVVTGTPETAALIRQISREIKPVGGFCDSLSASASCWIQSACDYIYCTRTAELGSIGVYSALYDYSEWMEREGIKLELFKAGDFKAMGLPGTELTEQQREHLQAGVVKIYETFKAEVREFRGREIADEVMQGQCFAGADAVEAGLADAVVASLDEAVDDFRQL